MLDLDKFKGHTEGPWYAFAPDDIGQKFSVERLGSNQFIKSRKIATVHHDKGNAEANARLIAAAPELLAEVVRLREANRMLEEAVKIATDFLEERFDTVDSSDGRPMANAEMSCHTEIQMALGNYP